MANSIYANMSAPTGAAQMRGAVDFTNSAQFTLNEKGHSLIAVLETPIMMNVIKEKYSDDKNMVNIIEQFPDIIESEFKGLDGLDGMSADSMEITDNISTLNILGSVNYSTNQEITMRFTEKAGRTLTRYCSTYLTAARDPKTRVKNYLGCASRAPGVPEAKNWKSGQPTLIRPSLDAEVFTFLYIVPDSSWSIVDNAYLLTNAYITKAPFDQLDNFDRGDVALTEIDLSFNTFVIANNKQVFDAANVFLKNYVERTGYTAGAWNINSEALKYNAFENAFTHSDQNKTVVSGVKSYKEKGRTAATNSDYNEQYNKLSQS